jgi:hypothetical protein
MLALTSFSLAQDAQLSLAMCTPSRHSLQANLEPLSLVVRRLKLRVAIVGFADTAPSLMPFKKLHYD